MATKDRLRYFQKRNGLLQQLRGQHLVVWLLVIGFLLQPILTYLATPVFGHDAEGVSVVICTLQGEKRVTLDLPSLAGTPDTSPAPLDLDHCPALKLFQIAGAAAVSAPALGPALMLLAVTVVDQTAVLPHHSLHFAAYSTRAPPVA